MQLIKLFKIPGGSVLDALASEERCLSGTEKFNPEADEKKVTKSLEITCFSFFLCLRCAPI